MLTWHFYVWIRFSFFGRKKVKAPGILCRFDSGFIRSDKGNWNTINRSGGMTHAWKK